MKLADYKKIALDFLVIFLSAAAIWGVLFLLAVCGDRLASEAAQESVTAEPAAPEVVATEPAAYHGPVPEVVDLGEFTVTHYCPCAKCCGVWAENRPDGIVYTASGAIAQEGRTIAVDPDLIPYGTEVVVRYSDGDEAVYIAEDCGSAIQGNRIDVYMESHEAALLEGIKAAKVCIVKEK